MRQRLVVLGLLGALGLVAGCASDLTGSAKTPTPGATELGQLGTADPAAPTKPVTLAVSRMT